MTKYLIVSEGPLKGRRFVLGPRTIIGRADGSELQILAEGVSRQHAAIIENDEGALYLMDLASKNGTFVDGKPIFRVLLEPGARFRISTHEFLFNVTSDADTPEPASANPSVDPSRQRGHARKQRGD